MPPPINPEAFLSQQVAGEILDRPVVLTGRGAKEASAAFKLAQEMDPKKVNAGNYEALLKKGASAMPDRQQAVGSHIEGIGTEDPVTGKIDRTPEQEALYKRAKDAAEPAVTYGREGFDKLTPAQQVAYRDRLLAELNQRPEFKAQLDKAANDAERQAIAAKILRENPKLRAAMDKELEAITTNPELALGDDSEIIAAREARDIAKERVDTLAEQRADIDRQLADIQRRLDDFKPAEGGNPPGAAEAELVRLSGSEAARAGQIRAATGRLTRLQEDLASNQRLYEEAVRTKMGQKDYVDNKSGKVISTTRDLDPDIQRYTEEIKRLRQELDTVNAEIERLNSEQERLVQLRTEKKYLQDENARLQGEAKANDKAKTGADADLAKREGALKKAETARNEREKAVAEAYEGAFDRACSNFLDQEIDERVRAYQESLPKAVEQLAAQKADAEAQRRAALEDQVTEALTKRYIWNKRVRGSAITGRPRYVRAVMGHRIDADFNELIYADNPDAMLARLGITDPTEQAQMRGFVTGKVCEIRQQILQKGINPLENQLLVAKPWFAEALPDLIKTNEGFKAALENKLGETVDAKSIPDTVLNRIKRILRVNPALVMMAVGATQIVATAAKGEEKRG